MGARHRAARPLPPELIAGDMRYPAVPPGMIPGCRPAKTFYACSATARSARAKKHAASPSRPSGLMPRAYWCHGGCLEEATHGQLNHAVHIAAVTQIRHPHFPGTPTPATCLAISPPPGDPALCAPEPAGHMRSSTLGARSSTVWRTRARSSGVKPLAPMATVRLPARIVRSNDPVPNA